MPKISVQVPQRRLHARRCGVEVAPPLFAQRPAPPLGVGPRVRRCLPRLGLEQVPLHVQLQQLSFWQTWMVAAFPQSHGILTWSMLSGLESQYQISTD